MDNAQLSAFLFNLSIWLLPGLFAITVHEAAHGLCALWYGDKTAFFLDRTSLSPFKHVDPVGTVMVPLFLLFIQSNFMFGWAKPVPINPRNLKNPTKDMAVIALAGPAANLVMAALWILVAKIGFALLPTYPSPQLTWLIQCARVGIFFNLILAVFNLLPIPPLDGSKILCAFLPFSLADQLNQLEPYGLLIVMTLLITGILPLLIGPPLQFLFQFVQYTL